MVCGLGAATLATTVTGRRDVVGLIGGFVVATVWLRPEAVWIGGMVALVALVAVLRPGGRLVYSTCSIEPQENEERVAALLRRCPFLVELDTRLFLPHRVDSDGGYYSLLTRSASKED